MNTSLNVKVIIGSTRLNRFGDKPANWIAEIAKQNKELSVEVLDLRDYPFPFFESAIPPSHVQGSYGNPTVDSWAAKIAEADTFIIVSPEYNHGPSAVIKNALDVIFKEWSNKPVAFVSYGSVGGARAVEQLRQIAIELQMAPIRQSVHIMAPWMLQDENGLKAGALDPYQGAGTALVQQLTWWAKTLKAGREQA